MYCIYIWDKKLSTTKSLLWPCHIFCYFVPLYQQHLAKIALIMGKNEILNPLLISFCSALTTSAMTSLTATTSPPPRQQDVSRSVRPTPPATSGPGTPPTTPPAGWRLPRLRLSPTPMSSPVPSTAMEIRQLLILGVNMTQWGWGCSENI